MTPATSRKFAIVGSVLLLHAMALWALQSGLLTRAVEVVTPVQVLAASVPVPTSASPAPAPKAAVEPPKQIPKTTQPVPEPSRAAPPPVVSATPVNVPAAVTPLAAASEGPPSPAAPVGVSVPQGGAQPAPSVANTAARVELPSSDADYLHNPKPEYPRMSRQRNEQGKVVVNVFIGTDGLAQKAEIKASSGFERLDAAALATVKAWRYVPGKRGGVAEAMWFAVPINFVME